jgi:hypothetical protein
MMDCIKRGGLLVLFLPVLLTSSVSCTKFEGEQTVPSYISIDTFYLQDNPELQEGRLTHDFVDVWLRVDDQLIGAFEMPAIIPVLESGLHKITLLPGIKYNTQSGTRGPHPYIKPYEVAEFMLTTDSIVTFKNPRPNVEYYSNTNFALVEEFESQTGTFIETSNSDTSIVLYEQSQSNFNRFGNTSGAGYLVKANTVFEIVSFEEDSPGFQFPIGVPVVFEMEYKTNITMLVGVFIKDGSTITQHSILVLNPSGDAWNKAYVNLTPTVLNNPNADAFNVFVRADKTTGGDTAIVLVDNFKLIHRNPN